MKLVGLGDSAQAFLTAFATELANHVDTVPDAVYVAAGEIPWDGESLIMYMASEAQGVPGRPNSLTQVSVATAISYVTFFIELIRDVSTFGYEGGVIGLPSDEAMANEGVAALNDAGALVWTALTLKDEQIPVMGEIDFVIGPCNPVGPMGGLAAMRLQLDISVDGT